MTFRFFFLQYVRAGGAESSSLGWHPTGAGIKNQSCCRVHPGDASGPSSGDQGGRSLGVPGMEVVIWGAHRDSLRRGWMLAILGRRHLADGEARVRPS